MRILIVGNSDSVWIRNFIKYILMGDGNKIELLCLGREAVGKWNEEYQDWGVKQIRLPESLRKLQSKTNKSLPEKIYLGIFISEVCRKLGQYDVVNLHYVSIPGLAVLSRMKGLHHNLILSYWGSDLLCIHGDAIFEKIFLRLIGASYATFDNGDLEDEFNRRFGFAKLRKKVAMFSLPILEEINRTKMKDCTMIAGTRFSEDKIAVCVGYNGGESQQHLKVIEQLSKIEDAYKKDICIALQMTYGGSNEYKEKCKQCCSDAGFDFVLFSDFMQEKDVAKLRRRADIFINAQTTDAFAGSFCEYMYTDTVVINAKWLHYKELDEYPFTYREFQEFEDLPRLLVEVLTEMQKEGRKKKQGTNKEIIWQLRANENCKQQWQEVFQYVAGNKSF